MHDDDRPTASAEQDAWAALAGQFRTELERLAPLAGAMKPDEIKTLIDASQAAMWMHFQASTWDKRMQLEQARVTAAD